jgi:hypothetical protein
MRISIKFGIGVYTEILSGDHNFRSYLPNVSRIFYEPKA